MSKTIKNEINTNNIKIVDITDLLECPICLNNIIGHDPYFIMACCKNKMHLECLINWYSTNSKLTKCFICNQSTNFYNEFIKSNKIHDVSNIRIESVNTNILRNNFSAPMLDNTRNYYNYRDCCCVDFILSFIR